MRRSYHRVMFDIAGSLRVALDSASRELRSAERSVASANAGTESGRSADAAMARTARAAIFDEALLAAMRARLEEIKAVAK